MTTRVPDALTLTEAVKLMDPPIPLRTLQARVQAAERRGDIAYVAVRGAGPHGGRPAREYRAGDLFAVHREWVFSTQGKRAAPGHILPGSMRPCPEDTHQPTNDSGGT